MFVCIGLCVSVFDFVVRVFFFSSFLFSLIRNPSLSCSFSSRHFALVSEVPDSKPPRNDTAKDLIRVALTWGLLIAIIVVSAIDDDKLLLMCLLTVTIQIYMQVLTLAEAWGAVKGGVLLTIASSFALGAAIESCGLSDIIVSY